MKWIPIILASLFTNSSGGQSASEWFNKGVKSDSLGQFSMAVDCYNKALQFDNNNSTTWYNRGVSRMFLKEYSLALVDFNRAIYLDTGLTEAYYYRSIANEKTNNFHFALADINAFISRHPQDYMAISNRVELCLKMRDVKQAIVDLTLLNKIFPDSFTFEMALLNIYFSEGMNQEGLDLSHRIMKNRPGEWNVYYMRSYFNHELGNYSASIHDANMYLLEFPDNTEIKELKADNCFYLKNFEEAAELYWQLLQGDGNNPDLLADYGHCLLQLKQYSKANEILTKSIQTNNASPAYAYLGRGIARFNMGLKDEACQDWSKSEKLGELGAQRYINLNCKNENAQFQR